jgi:hypothetical protein
VLSTRVENYQSIFPRPFWLQVSLKMTSQSQLETALSNEIWLRTNPMSALGEPLQQRHNNLVGDGSVKQEQCPGYSRQTGKRPTRHDAADASRWKSFNRTSYSTRNGFSCWEKKVCTACRSCPPQFQFDCSYEIANKVTNLL